MHFPTRVRTWRVALVCTVYSVLYSEIALSRKPFGIGHMYIHTFMLTMTDTMTSKNVDLSSWNTLYNDGSSEGIELGRALEESIVA
jgi:hypothetical protein